MSQNKTDTSTTIVLPAHIGEQIENRIDGTQFETADEYVTYVLEQVMAHIDREDSAPPAEAGQVDEAAAVEDRLESLGYL